MRFACWPWRWCWLSWRFGRPKCWFGNELNGRSIEKRAARSGMRAADGLTKIGALRSLSALARRLTESFQNTRAVADPRNGGAGFIENGHEEVCHRRILLDL